ncbi:protein translocase subunit SecD [Agromyces atrinae]|uniref:Protein translocase subunit SecD n=1 Tax=Agromyces atrinae TaxID=592376 RepID=A0A852SBK8_9MICO|nr:protein translocase subunit SecD [Agromyces atrinae]MCI2958894.1 protein translocase subunit SecD [Agromyces atrinae]NYD65880.1 preprotein translocase subunit SecD [Agromyces atrinae]
MAQSKRSSQPTTVRKAWRSLSWLGVIIVGLFAINAAGVIWGGGSWTPKLALDLEGGTQIILAPQLESGQTVTQDQLDQAVSIIRQRVDSSGVSEAEINTQGQNVVVAIPGALDDETRQRIESSAKLELRPVLAASAATDASASPTDPAATDDPAAEEPSTTPTAEPTDGSDPSWITPAVQEQFDSFSCASLNDAETSAAPADEPLVTCDNTGTVKYILGPVEVSGENIVDATNGMGATQTGASTGQWVVNLRFDDKGTEDFGKVSTRLFGLKAEPPRDQFAFVLDGQVLSAPSMNGIITDGRPSISGNFTQESSKALADQLKFGALPISFTVQSNETITATLGGSQLQSGLIAGLIGLILVVIYTLFQYRLLGLVTIASLVVAAVITYLVITIMSWREGYRLSLAGIAGLIVAIGFTADSFIVYFERVRDELRDGRSLTGAVEAGWKRALRTILASKATNLLAAIVLFILAVGNVKGFAFTLGITTVIDVIIVIMFTHPMLQLLAQTKFFSSGHSASGLDPTALGAVYRGRAEFRAPTGVTGKKGAASAKEAQKRQTIAERKAAELAGVGSTAPKAGSGEGKAD